MWNEIERNKRFYDLGGDEDRSPARKDYDRILYSSAFRRLAGITQIVRAGEADVFHTRQQHTFKVAQVGRRLAQLLVTKQGEHAEIFRLDEDVVEAACLAHDLGHPPFGHMGEKVLDKLCIDAGDYDGFEGNAQSLRIVTKLAVHKDSHVGLNLTRATIAACIKYPWLRDHDSYSQSSKWGAYHDDKEIFDFVKESFPGERKTLEAEIMDWADDITYSVHDLDEFHRCGVIPWNSLFEKDSKEALLKRALKAWHGAPAGSEQKLEQAFDYIESTLKSIYNQLVTEPYDGRREHRVALRSLSSHFISRYIAGMTINAPAAHDDSLKTVVIKGDYETEIRVLKQITRDYAVNNPSLAAQQAGQKRVIEFLFEALRVDSRIKKPNYLPTRLAYLWDLRGGSLGRFCTDCIASLTETEVMKLYSRLSGAEGGSVLDPIVR